MKKDEKSLAVCAVLMAASAVGGAVLSVRNAIKSRRETKKADQEFEETMKIAEQNLKDLKDLNEWLKAEEERKQIEAIQHLKEELERQKREDAEHGQTYSMRRLIDRANTFMEKYESQGNDDDEVPE